MRELEKNYGNMRNLEQSLPAYFFEAAKNKLKFCALIFEMKSVASKNNNLLPLSNK